MASLNTLRTKGGVIVSVVIGVALLAFLVGDLFSSGSSMLNSRKMRVGEIAGTNIGYVEYTEATDKYEVIARAMSNGESLDTEGYEMVRQMAWESLINEYAYRPGFEKLGLVASEAEQVDMVNGVYMSPVLTQSFTNPQTGAYDPTFLQGFVARAQADQSGQTMTLWNYMKEQMRQERVLAKYTALISNALFINDLETATDAERSKDAYDVRIVCKPYSSVADSTVSVSAAEISAYYNAHKNLYKREASRDIEYVVFDLTPSEKDFTDAAKYIAQIAEEFEASDAPMQYAMLNSQVRPVNRYMKRSEVSPAIAESVFGNAGAVYGPELEYNTYVVARQADAKMIPDTVTAKGIILAPTDKAVADSIVTAIKGGADFGELAMKYSLDQNSAQNGGLMGDLDPTMFPEEFIDPIVAAKINEPFVVNSSYIYLMQITRKTAPTLKAQIAEIRYEVEPSSATQTAAYNEVSQFYTKAAGSYDKFEAAANEAVVSKRVARISSSDKNVTGLGESRELVRWAFNADKGNVSSIMQLGGDYVVAVLTDAKEAGIATEKEMADQITALLSQRKKADAIIASVAGMSFDQITAKFEDEPVEAMGITFSTPYIQGVGREPKLAGAIATGKSASPVAGNAGVYAYEITGQTANEAAASQEDLKVRLEAMSAYRLQERAAQAMLEQTEIVDSRVKFF